MYVILHELKTEHWCIGVAYIGNTLFFQEVRKIDSRKELVGEVDQISLQKESFGKSILGPERESWLED